MEWFLHALKDSAILLPFLFVSYIIIELLENAFSSKINNAFFKGKWAPVIGAGLGIIPQCGFSVVATDLYSKKKISVGTLVAIFIATSDEAIPILISNLNSSKNALLLVGLVLTKLVVAIIAGLVIDLILAKKQKQIAVQTVEAHTNKEAEEQNHHEEHSHKGCCNHDIEENNTNWAKKYLLHPLIHTLKVFVYILAVNIIFELLLHYIGADKIESFLQTSYYFAPLIACLIGLIPNCASSVILTNLLVIGGLSFSACLTGLIVNAGIAYLVLFKQNKNQKHNFAIVGTMMLIGLVVGYGLMIFGL